MPIPLVPLTATMQTNNTVQTLIDYVKDLTGQTNLADAKSIRALNFAVDNYSFLALTSSGKWQWDSRNQSDVSRVTTTSSDSTLDLENELLSLLELEVLVGGKYKRLTPADYRDSAYDSLKSATGTPTHYDLVGNQIRLLGTPDASYNYRLTYGRNHPRYSADNLTANTGVLPIHEEYVALYAADRVMIGMSDSARAAVRNELQVKEAEVRDFFSKRDQATVKRLKATIPSTFKNKSR